MHCMSVGVASSVHRAAVTDQIDCTGDTCVVVGVGVGMPPVKAHLLGHGHQRCRVFTIPTAGHGRSQSRCGGTLQVWLLGIESVALTCSVAWCVALSHSIMPICGRMPSHECSTLVSSLNDQSIACECGFQDSWRRASRVQDPGQPAQRRADQRR